MQKYFFDNDDPGRPIRRKQVGHLKDILRDNDIRDQVGLRTWIANRSSIQHGEATFKVISAGDLELDDENRFYGRELKLREVIVDAEEVVVRNSLCVKLIDCVFMGRLIIGNNTGKPVNVQLDTVVIGDKLSVNGSCNEVSVGLTDVRCPNAFLTSLRCDEVALSGCAMANLSLSGISAGRLSVVGSQLGAVEVVDCTFKAVWFAPRQVDLAALREVPTLLRRIIRRRPEFKAFQLPTSPSLDARLDEMSRSEAIKRRVQTLDFLQVRSEDRYSRRDSAELKYLRALAECPGPYSKLWITLTGALVKPLRIVFAAVFTILMFAVVYRYAPLCFKDGAVISFLDALYFSGVSFTTIGYGDILPLGFARFLAVSEGLLGVVLSSALVVSIVRRHVE